MSGHSKWHSIKYKKGAADAKRGKVFTKHAKLITIAARDGGGDPEMNPSLRSAIINAKADNVPNDNIDKAIKKGSGTDKNAAIYTEYMYEGFGPCKTAIYVQCITDNKNRSVAAVKTIFTKNGGNMGEAGTVGWMFEKKGVIDACASDKSQDDSELEIIEAGAEDLAFDGENFEIITAPTSLMAVRDNLEKSGFAVKKAVLSYLPKEELKIESADDAKRILKLVEALEEDDDVDEVYGNFDIPEEILQQLS